MKNFLVILALLISGCSGLSPRQQQQIDNQNGKIGEIENIANGFKNELGNLKNQNDIQNSQLDKVQQGMLNLQSNYQNSGVQILSGPGGLVFSIVALIAATAIALHYRGQANVHAKTSEILAQSIASQQDPRLVDHVFRSAMYTDAEETILKLIKKHSA